VAGLNNGAVVAVDAMLFSLSGAEGNLLDKMEMERMGRETYRKGQIGEDGTL
jgi:hypothetical protein